MEVRVGETVGTVVGLGVFVALALGTAVDVDAVGEPGTGVRVAAYGGTHVLVGLGGAGVLVGPYGIGVLVAVLVGGTDVNVLVGGTGVGV
jgi:hypothetical protein